jgi:L-alanine-DL-glutamate epimerase-like enolase superfamily enzyme
MDALVQSYSLHKLEVPTGRLIGDNNCAYECLDLICLRLENDSGEVGWGYGESCWKGTFSKPAWYIRPMESLQTLTTFFDAEIWPMLNGRSPQAALDGFSLDGTRAASLVYLATAVRTALWDLCAKEAGLPLFQLLADSPGAVRSQVTAYGSPLDYHLSDADAVRKTQDFLNMGMQAIKVKIGAPEANRDIARLRLIRDAVPGSVEITADANIAWTATQTLERLDQIAAAGIRLGYLEDPLPPEDVAGFAQLAKARPGVPIIAHDYIAEPDKLRRVLDTGALSMIRLGKDVDYVRAGVKLAKEYGVGIVFGNSMFEFNVHFACAFAGVDRLEFSDLAWNRLLIEPVRFESGMAIAPSVPGHGLAPDPEMLERWNQPSGGS